MNFRSVIALALGGLVVVPLIFGGPQATAVATNQADSSPGAMPAGLEADQAGLVNALRKDHPSLTESEAKQSVAGQESRLELRERLAELLPTEYAGSSYDAVRGIETIFTTSPEAAKVAEAAASAAGISVEVTTDAYSIADLQALVDRISAKIEREKLSSAVATIDYSNNRVAVSVAGDEPTFAALQQLYLADGRIKVQLYDDPTSQDLCTSRLSCGSPARRGIVIGLDTDGAGPIEAQASCSYGFGIYSTPAHTGL